MHIRMSSVSSCVTPVATTLLMLGAVGCDSGETDRDQHVLESVAFPQDAGEADAAEVTLLDGGLDGGLDGDSAPSRPDASADGVLPDPAGAYYASVRANGTGCPAGTTSTAISSDGKKFRVEFSAYYVELTSMPEEPQVTKNCSLSFKFHRPNGFSFAVKSFAYQGYAFLEQGVQASHWARYYFAGSPVPPTNSNRVVVTGPYDDDFVFRDEVETSDMVWSPCGTARDLNVYTVLQLRNSKPRRAGYATVQYAADLELAWRGCNGAPLPAPN